MKKLILLLVLLGTTSVFASCESELMDKLVNIPQVSGVIDMAPSRDVDPNSYTQSQLDSIDTVHAITRSLMEAASEVCATEEV